MDKIDTLIRDLEATDVGCLELSASVLLAFGWTAKKGQSVWHLPDGTLYGPAHGAGFMPDPTTSIDDALELVPEGWSLAGWWEAVNPKDRPWWGVNLRRDDPYKVLNVKDSTTPAVVLVIAALKARRGA